MPTTLVINPCFGERQPGSQHGLRAIKLRGAGYFY